MVMALINVTSYVTLQEMTSWPFQINDDDDAMNSSVTVFEQHYYYQ